MREVSFSPVVSIEPRRRKFHRTIELRLPLPATFKPQLEHNLRLLCSIEEGQQRAEWKDMTESIRPFQVDISNHLLVFPTTISARYWLCHCSEESRAKHLRPLAQDLYRRLVCPPFMAKFVIFAKRRALNEAQLRLFCMTDDKEERTLEEQEHFRLVARSRDVEVSEGQRIYLELGGNLMALAPSGNKWPQSSAQLINEQPSFVFKAFQENRLALQVGLRELQLAPEGRIAFMEDSIRYLASLSHQQRDFLYRYCRRAICALALQLPPMCLNQEAVLGTPRRNSRLATARVGQLSLMEVAQALETEVTREAERARSPAGASLSGDSLQADQGDHDWVRLAPRLGIPRDEVELIAQHCQISPALLLLIHWHQLTSPDSRDQDLARGLLAIGRQDIASRLGFPIEPKKMSRSTMELLREIDLIPVQSHESLYANTTELMQRSARLKQHRSAASSRGNSLGRLNSQELDQEQVRSSSRSALGASTGCNYATNQPTGEDYYEGESVHRISTREWTENRNGSVSHMVEQTTLLESRPRASSSGTNKKQRRRRVEFNENNRTFGGDDDRQAIATVARRLGGAEGTSESPQICHQQHQGENQASAGGAIIKLGAGLNETGAETIAGSGPPSATDGGRQGAKEEHEKGKQERLAGNFQMEQEHAHGQQQRQAPPRELPEGSSLPSLASSCWQDCAQAHSESWEPVASELNGGSSYVAPPADVSGSDDDDDPDLDPSADAASCEPTWNWLPLGAAEPSGCCDSLALSSLSTATDPTEATLTVMEAEPRASAAPASAPMCGPEPDGANVNVSARGVEGAELGLEGASGDLVCARTAPSSAQTGCARAAPREKFEDSTAPTHGDVAFDESCVIGWSCGATSTRSLEVVESGCFPHSATAAAAALDDLETGDERGKSGASYTARVPSCAGQQQQQQQQHSDGADIELDGAGPLAVSLDETKAAALGELGCATAGDGDGELESRRVRVQVEAEAAGALASSPSLALTLEVCDWAKDDEQVELENWSVSCPASESSLAGDFADSQVKINNDHHSQDEDATISEEQRPGNSNSNSNKKSSTSSYATAPLAPQSQQQQQQQQPPSSSSSCADFTSAAGDPLSASTLSRYETARSELSGQELDGDGGELGGSSSTLNQEQEEEQADSDEMVALDQTAMAKPTAISSQQDVDMEELECGGGNLVEGEEVTELRQALCCSSSSSSSQQRLDLSEALLQDDSIDEDQLRRILACKRLSEGLVGTSRFGSNFLQRKNSLHMIEELPPLTEGEAMKHHSYHLSQTMCSQADQASTSSHSSGSQQARRPQVLGMKRGSQEESCSSSTSLERSPSRRRSSTVSQCSSVLSEGTRNQLNFDLSPDLAPDSSLLEANALGCQSINQSPLLDLERPPSPEPSSLSYSYGHLRDLEEEERPESRLGAHQEAHQDQLMCHLTKSPDSTLGDSNQGSNQELLEEQLSRLTRSAFTASTSQTLPNSSSSSESFAKKADDSNTMEDDVDGRQSAELLERLISDVSSVAVSSQASPKQDSSAGKRPNSDSGQAEEIKKKSLLPRPISHQAHLAPSPITKTCSASPAPSSLSSSTSSSSSSSSSTNTSSTIRPAKANLQPTGTEAKRNDERRRLELIIKMEQRVEARLRSRTHLGTSSPLTAVGMGVKEKQTRVSVGHRHFNLNRGDNGPLCYCHNPS